MSDHSDTAAITFGDPVPDSDLTPDTAGPAEDQAADSAADLAQDQEPGGGTDPAGDQAGCELPWCGSVPLEARVPSRLVMPVEWLTAHPGNVRADLDLGPEFLASIAENGVLVPLRITITGDGDGYRVIDGHRRLAAAVKAGLAEVPYDLAADRRADEAGQYLDMYTAHHHRKGLRPGEEADALFAASEAGASRTRIRKATGLKAAQVKAALAAGGLSGETRAAVADAGYDLTLEDLAILAEFQDDPQAVGQLLDVARYGAGLEHQAQRLRLLREEQAAHQRLRAELEAAGLTLTDSLPPGAQLLRELRHDGGPLTAEAHAGCPGRGAFFYGYDLASPVHYCAGPDEHGHAPMWETPAGASPDSPAASAGGAPGDGGDGITRRVVIEGNRAWKAACTVRHRWLAGQLFARRTAPRQVAPFLARQLLALPGPLRSGLELAGTSGQFPRITGRDGAGWLELCGTAAPGRLPLLMLAPVAVTYERALSDPAGKDTWRPGRYSPCPYEDAGRYLAFLASLGYQLSAIERSVADGTPYAGDDPAGDTVTVRLVSDPDDGDRAGDGDQDVPQDVPGRQDVPAGTEDVPGLEQAA